MSRKHRKARQLLKKYLQGKCNPEEIELLHRWYDELPYYLSADSADAQSIQAQLNEAIWQKIGARRPAIRRIGYRAAAAAAVIGVLVISGTYWLSRPGRHHYREFDNPTAGVQRVVLPDRSAVSLNAHSHLRWDDDARRQRSVELEGEGYFEVANDAAHPFTVVSHGIATKVLGTSFNVEAYAGETQVRISLVSGSVEVTSLDGHQGPVRLRPGQIARVEPGGQVPVDVQQGDAGNFSAWTGGGFILQDVPLGDALRRLCTRYGYTLKTSFSTGREKPITTAFYNDNFKEILTGLLYINHLNYSIRDSVVTIY